MNMTEQVLDVPTQEVITRDNATVSADGITFYQVIDAPRAAYEVTGLQNALLAITMTNIRTVIGGMDLDEVLSKRDEINDKLLHVVDAAAAAWGVKVTRIEIKDISPPRDLVDAMARQMKAEREKRAQILEAEGARASEILKAEGEKQGLILQAEGRREAAFRDAEARERLAEAEAKATTMVSEAVAKGDVQALNYFVAQKYTQALEALASAPGQRVLMLPIEASALIGSLAGIAELAKASFGEEAIARRSGTGAGDRRRRHAMILDFIRDLGAWAWWVGGAILLALEIVAPGNVFVWFGIAAILTGAVALVADISWQVQLILFAVAVADPGHRRPALLRAGLERARSRSSTSAPPGSSARATCSATRSSTAPAGSGSAIRCGG